MSLRPLLIVLLLSSAILAGCAAPQRESPLSEEIALDEAESETIAASETPIATATNEPLVIVSNYSEDFEADTSCFDEFESDFASFAVGQGQLNIRINGAAKLAWSECPTISVGDFRLEAAIRDDSTEGFRFVGFQIRKELEADSDHEHYIVRFGSGDDKLPSWCVAYASDSSFESITSSPEGDSCWQEIPFDVDFSQWNQFEIVAQASSISIVINGQDVGGITDDRLAVGSLVILAGTNSAEQAHFVVDDLLVSSMD